MNISVKVPILLFWTMQYVVLYVLVIEGWEDVCICICFIKKATISV